MENSINIALSRQEALRRQLDVVANNIANMNTTGYKQQRVLFQEYLDKPARGERLSFVQDFGVMRDTRPSAVTVTDNPLDVALRGQGYFAVETFNGPRFTRAGSFQINDQRELVDGSGLPVLGEGDARIAIPADAVDVRIEGDGTIRSAAGPIGRLKVVTFDDEQLMLELGGGLYTTEQEQRVVERPQITQGALETSNVQPITETVQMTEILRQYQSNQRLIDSEHERLRTAIQRLTRQQ